MTEQLPLRLAWIDWLKVLVVLGVFVYHAAQPFVLATWIVVAEEKSLLLSAFAGLGYLFGMPLMFLLAGAASWAALRTTPVRTYVGKRLRLTVPLVAGIAILSPVQAWVGALTRGDATPLPEFVVGFWRDVEPVTGPIWLGLVGYHLWFIGFLLIYAVVSVPILLRMRPGEGPMRSTALLLTTPIAALTVLQLPLRSAYPAYRDWADFALWLGYFLLGAAMLAWRPMLAALTRHGRIMLVPGVLLAGALVPLFLVGPGFSLESEPRFDLPGVAYLLLRTAVGWCWVSVAVWIGARWFDRRPEQARAASGLVLPFYVLHHPIVVVVAAIVVTWPVGAWLKFAAIVGWSLALSVGVSAAVARTRLLRPGLGLGAPARPDGMPARRGVI